MDLYYRIAMANGLAIIPLGLYFGIIGLSIQVIALIYLIYKAITL